LEQFWDEVKRGGIPDGKPVHLAQVEERLEDLKFIRAYYIDSLGKFLNSDRKRFAYVFGELDETVRGIDSMQSALKLFDQFFQGCRV
jgi:hypothetical protein